MRFRLSVFSLSLVFVLACGKDQPKGVQAQPAPLEAPAPASPTPAPAPVAESANPALTRQKALEKKYGFRLSTGLHLDSLSEAALKHAAAQVGGGGRMSTRSQEEKMLEKLEQYLSAHPEITPQLLPRKIGFRRYSGYMDSVGIKTLRIHSEETLHMLAFNTTDGADLNEGIQELENFIATKKEIARLVELAGTLGLKVEYREGVENELSFVKTVLQKAVVRRKKDEFFPETILLGKQTSNIGEILNQEGKLLFSLEQREGGNEKSSEAFFLYQQRRMAGFLKQERGVTVQRDTVGDIGNREIRSADNPLVRPIYNAFKSKAKTPQPIKVVVSGFRKVEASIEVEGMKEILLKESDFDSREAFEKAVLEELERSA